MKTQENTFIWSAAAVALLLPAWWIGYLSTNFLASPIDVAKALPAFLMSAETWYHIGITVWRVGAGLACGIVMGTLVAFAMRQHAVARESLAVYVTMALRTPSAIAAIMALAIFKGSEIGHIAVVAFITFPFMTIGLLDGLRSADRDLDNLAQVYRLGTWRHIRHILTPFVAPYIFSALRNSHALAWKIIIVVEILGTAKAGFGAKFAYAWNYFLMVEVHLWLLVFMALVLLAEYGILRIAERYVFRWRA